MNPDKMPAKPRVLSGSGGKKEFIVGIKDERCKGCAICVEICPKQVLAMSKEPMASGYLLAQVVDQAKCIGCLECELHCPDLAVEVTPVTSKADKK